MQRRSKSARSSSDAVVANWSHSPCAARASHVHCSAHCSRMNAGLATHSPATAQRRHCATASALGLADASHNSKKACSITVRCRRHVVANTPRNFQRFQRVEKPHAGLPNGRKQHVVLIISSLASTSLPV